MEKSGKCCVLKSLSQRNPPVQIRGDAGMRQEEPSGRGGLTSGPSLWSYLESCRGGFSFPGAAREAWRQCFIFLYLLPDLKLLEGLCEDDGGCVSPGAWSPSGTDGGRGAIPKQRVAVRGWGWLSKWGISSPALFRVLVGIQQRVLTGSQAGGTGRSFPAFGFWLLQGEGGTGRAEQGWDGSREQS